MKRKVLILVFLSLIMLIGGHTISNAAYCTICSSDAPVSEHANCTSKTGWKYDSSYHYKYCCCGKKTDISKASHNTTTSRTS